MRSTRTRAMVSLDMVGIAHEGTHLAKQLMLEKTKFALNPVGCYNRVCLVLRQT